MAFRDGKKTDQAKVGAYLIADGLECLRELAGFLGGVRRAGGG